MVVIQHPFFPSTRNDQQNLIRIAEGIKVEFNWDIYFAIRAFLRENHDQEAVVRLSRISKAFYKTFEPLIDCTHLTLDKANAKAVLGVLDIDTEACDTDDTCTPDPSPQLAVLASTRLHNLRRIKECTHLHIKDIQALKLLCRTIQRQSDLDVKVPPDFTIFKGVTHLILGEAVTRHLGLSSDGKYHPLISFLQTSLRPTHLCIDYSSGMDYLGFSNRLYEKHPGESSDFERIWLEWDHQVDNLWPHVSQSGITHLCLAFMASWDLESVTLHGVGQQFLPLESHCPIRVFYNVELDNEHTRRWNKVRRERVRQMADAVSLLGPPDSSYEFVGAGGAFRLGKEEEEEQMAQDDVERAFWEEFAQDHLKEVLRTQVKFTTRHRAEACICCGKK